MSSYEVYIDDKFLRITNSVKFSGVATTMVSRYIQCLYAACTVPINLKVGLSILYDNIDEAKLAHKINRTAYDTFIILFQRDFDELCYTEFNPSNKRNRLNIIKTIKQTADKYIATFAPTIIEPVYETTV